MSMHVIVYDQKCKACNGTGLYIGLAERDGAAIVCHVCGGTGKHHVKIEYEDFIARLPHRKAEHVFQCNPGICIGRGTLEEYKLSDFGGMSYQDWLNGKAFERGMENRLFTCPAWWYQSADYELKPKWDECCGCCRFAGCKHFKKKDECWKRFDKEREESNE